MQEYILGGYTKRDNQGIKSTQFDPTNLQFTQPKLIAELNGPTYVALSQDKSLLFSIHRDDETNKGGLVAFEKDANNEWQELSRLFPSESTGCHVSFRESSRTIYVANYGLGQLDVYHLNSDNQLEHIQTVEHSGSGPHENQDAPHVHMGLLTPQQNTIIVCDLGTDYLSAYNLDNQGKMTLANSIHLPAGTGPRHAVLHPALSIIYVIGELNNTTNVIKVEEDGSFTLLQTLPNVPEDKLDSASGAAIRITKDGRFVYSSSRFHNILTVFETNVNDGTLTEVQQIETVGQIPRDFILDETDEFVLVAHQDSDYITVFERNTNTGELNFKNNDTYAAECVCIAHA